MDREARVDRNLRSAYPEIGAGGFSQVDGTIEFYTRVNALLTPDMTVLDLGAGRGSQLEEDTSDYRRALARVQGKVRCLIGVDVDPVVLENPFLDEAHVIDGRSAMPLADGSVDLIYADWVLEHVADPAAFSEDAFRILRPGGWFCARTPNRWGPTGIATNLVPNSAHTKLLSRLQPGRQARDVFPTTYKLNTRRSLTRYFPQARWDDYSYMHSSEPSYVLGSRAAIFLMRAYSRLAPQNLGTNFHIFLRKRASA